MMDQEGVELKKVLAKLANSNEINPDQLKKLKRICRKGDVNVAFAFKIILEFLRKEHSGVRLNCVLIADELFTRSHHFRTLLLNDFETFTRLTLGFSGRYLPPPDQFKKKLRMESIKKIKEWYSKYGVAYREFNPLYNSLKEFVDFDNLWLLNDEDRASQRAREERLESLWNERVNKIKEGFERFENDVATWLDTASNLLKLAEENEEPFKEELEGYYNELLKKFLPQINWKLDTLTKAGNRTDQDLLRKCVDIKTNLVHKKTQFEKYSLFKRDLARKIQPKKLETSLSSEDPASAEATIKKIIGEQSFLNTDFDDKVPSSSSSDSSVPCVRLEDLQEPDRMIVDPDKSRFWVSDHREGQELFVGATQKISEFAGKCLPVKWSCRVKLASGGLCPRMDRIKCPFHGPIIARNEDGEPDIFHPSQSNASTSKTTSTTKPARSMSRLKAASKYEESSRSRISKRIFNRKSAKRVSQDQKIYDKIRTKNKFVDQFNYS